MDRSRFYSALRRRGSGVFGTRLSQQQVRGMEAILDEALRRGTLLEHLAYMLATVYRETGRKMVPNAENLNYTTAARIRQVWPTRFPTVDSARPYVRNPRGLANRVYNGRMGNRLGSDDGWNFRGRGLPHLTGRHNYRKASEVTGVDLVSSPARALEMPIAVKILFDGMTQGWYTGKKLGDYINVSRKDYRNARRVVNRLDMADEIASHARVFEGALREADYRAGVPPIPAPRPEPLATYIVMEGDTLSEIAQRFNVDLHELAALNRIVNRDVIRVGDRLRLPPTREPQPPPVPPPPEPEPEPKGGFWAWLWGLFGR